MATFEKTFTADANIVSVDLKGKSASQRASLKMTALRNKMMGLSLPYVYTLNGVTITVTNLLWANGMPGVKLTATYGGKALPVDIDGYYFYNPPILIPDGRGEFIENVLEAAKYLVYKAVVDYARSHGAVI
jgi:hypothetical protein